MTAASQLATSPGSTIGESRPLVRDVLLRDGSTLRLRAPTPADYDDIQGVL